MGPSHAAGGIRASHSDYRLIHSMVMAFNGSTRRGDKSSLLYEDATAVRARADRGKKWKGMMRLLFALSAGVVLTAYASSGIIPVGQDTFMVTKQSSTGFHSGASVKAEIFPEAAVYCSKIGKDLQPVSDRIVDGVPGRSFASAELTFRCLAAGDPGLSRPTPKPYANVRIEQQTVQTSAPAAPPATDIYAELLKLKSLLDAKIITPDEFEQQKRKILSP